jgi:hypothetical protein
MKRSDMGHCPVPSWIQNGIPRDRGYRPAPDIPLHRGSRKPGSDIAGSKGVCRPSNQANGLTCDPARGRNSLGQHKRSAPGGIISLQGAASSRKSLGAIIPLQTGGFTGIGTAYEL